MVQYWVTRVFKWRTFRDHFGLEESVKVLKKKKRYSLGLYRGIKQYRGDGRNGVAEGRAVRHSGTVTVQRNKRTHFFKISEK